MGMEFEVEKWCELDLVGAGCSNAQAYRRPGVVGVLEVLVQAQTLLRLTVDLIQRVFSQKF